jgi:trigger factor
MQVNIKEINDFTRILSVQIDASELQGIESRVIQKIRKSAALPGFRKGRVPLGLIKQRYADTIKLELMEDSISEYYGKAIGETNLQPVSQGKINNLKFENIKDGMEFEIEIEVEPDIELKKYKGLKVEKEIPIVTDEMQERVLNSLREQYATISKVDDSKEGDHITFDAQLLGEGDVPVVGKKFENISVKIGSGDFDPEFEKELIGLINNQKSILRKSVPPDPSKNRNKPTTESYEIKVKQIEEKELPELNDEFVKNIQDETLETLAQLKERINTNLKKDLKHRSQEQFVSRLIDELLKENPFDVPSSMVEHYLDHLIEDIKNQSKDKNIDEAAVRQNYRAYGIHNIRWYLLKKKLIEIENINVEMSEIEQRIDNMNLEDNQKKQLRQNIQFKNNLKDDLLEQKLIGLLESHADIVEIFPQQKTPADTAKKETQK